MDTWGTSWDPHQKDGESKPLILTVPDFFLKKIFYFVPYFLFSNHLCLLFNLALFQEIIYKSGDSNRLPHIEGSSKAHSSIWLDLQKVEQEQKCNIKKKKIWRKEEKHKNNPTTETGNGHKKERQNKKYKVRKQACLLHWKKKIQREKNLVPTEKK